MNPWRAVKEIWSKMTLKKKDFYREVTPMTRVYTQAEMVLFSLSVTIGATFFHSIPLNIFSHGDHLMFIWILYTPILFITSSCFAEMAALMPAVGAHYHYCYSTIGELVGFLVGWNMIFAYTIIIINKCKFLGLVLDYSCLNGWIFKNLRFMQPMLYFPFIIHGYVDILSLLIAISMAIKTSLAVNVTKRVVNFLTIFNITVIIVSTIAFSTKIDFNNASIGDMASTNELYDAFYIVQGALVGYESLAVLGEESKNPTKTIPLSIMMSVQILMILYIVYSFVLSPCMLGQDYKKLDRYNPLGDVVNLLGMPWLYWLVTPAFFFSMWCSSYGFMFIMVRILYAMSRDGMIFKVFSKIDRFTQKLVIPAFIYGLIVGLAVTFISVPAMFLPLSFISTKIMTTVCLLITRNKHFCFSIPSHRYRYINENRLSDAQQKPKDEKAKTWVLFNFPHPETEPTETTSRISMFLIYDAVISGFCIMCCFGVIYISGIVEINIIKIFGFFSIIFCFIFTYLLRAQPTQDRTNLAFITPYVPMYPLVAILADFFSCMIMSNKLWIVEFLWTVLGIIFYFLYSIWHSEESRNRFSDGTRWNPLELMLTSGGEQHPLEKRD